MKTGNNALEFCGVVKKYGRRVALDGLDLAVPRGSIFGLVGSNGAGKTTSFSVAAGLVKTSGGKVNVLGGGAFDAARDAGRLSIVPQDAVMPLYGRVAEVVEFYAQLQGMEPRVAGNNTEEVLAWVHLSDRAGSTIRSLSHGMRKRVCIAQAFLGAPELVLLDEPLSGLDPREVVSVRDMILERRGRQTIVISSHNLHEVEQVCDHVAFIKKGKLVRQDAIDAVVGKHALVTYRLTGRVADVEALGSLAGGVIFTMDGRGADGNYELRCEYDGSARRAEEVNGIVMRHLLDSGVGILEVGLGGRLESAYMEMDL